MLTAPGLCMREYYWIFIHGFVRLRCSSQILFRKSCGKCWVAWLSDCVWALLFPVLIYKRRAAYPLCACCHLHSPHDLRQIVCDLPAGRTESRSGHVLGPSLAHISGDVFESVRGPHSACCVCCRSRRSSLLGAAASAYPVPVLQHWQQACPQRLLVNLSFVC